MCNPRRVNVTATQQLAEAWQREVTRTVQMQGRAVGEARVRRPLATSMADTMLRALEAELAQGRDGWREATEGYQIDLEGGRLVYHLADQSLEIVARLEEEVTVHGTATENLAGVVTDTVSVEGVGNYYDDGWGGRTEETARRTAEEDAQRRLAEEARERREAASHAGAEAADAGVRARAAEAARAELAQEQQRRQAVLARRAEERLNAFQATVMQRFYRSVAAAYRNVLLVHARRQGASDIVERDDGDVVEISFRLPA
jgi:hypothetical protein